MAADADGTTVDVKLFRIIGLYQMLCPAEDCGHGGRTRRAWLALALLGAGYYAAQFAWLRAAADDVPRALYTVMILTYSIGCTVKGYALARHAAALWSVLDACRFSFTACGARRPAAVRRCRDTVSRLLRWFFALMGTTAAMWVSVPVVWPAHVSVARADGTAARYRTTVFSLWFPLPERAHNSPPGWMALYAAEVFFFGLNVCNFTLFDCYLITVCFTLHAQFRTVAAGCATLGRRGSRPRSTRPHDRPTDVNRNMLNESIQRDHYNDLICHIKDIQKLIKKLDEFFDVIQPIIIFQMVISSCIVISFIFFVCLEFVSRRSLMNVIFLKLFVSLISLTVQLFIYCYAFNLIETAKSSLNFGLYSCNWTEMDLRFKKTMSLAMVVNSSHKRKMKITPIYVINLEFFFKVMKTSFSIVPVLLELST